MVQCSTLGRRSESNNGEQQRASWWRRQPNQQQLLNDDKTKWDLMLLVSGFWHRLVPISSQHHLLSSPDQYVGQGAQQAEGGDWSETSEQHTGHQKHQRQQGTHQSWKSSPWQAVRQQTGRDHQIQCASHQQFNDLQCTKKQEEPLFTD